MFTATRENQEKVAHLIDLQLRKTTMTEASTSTSSMGRADPVRHHNGADVGREIHLQHEELFHAHTRHGMQHRLGHVRHERQPKKCLNLENLCESIAIDERLTVEDRRHCGQGKAAKFKGLKRLKLT